MEGNRLPYAQRVLIRTAFVLGAIAESEGLECHSVISKSYACGSEFHTLTQIVKGLKDVPGNTELCSNRKSTTPTRTDSK